MFQFLKKNKTSENGPTEAEALQHVADACNHRPVATFDIICASDNDLQIVIERKGTSIHGTWMVTKSEQIEIPVGCQVILVNGVPVPDASPTVPFFSLDCFLGWPSQLTFVLPPYKKGAVLKKSRTGWEKWNERVLEISGGRIRYWDASDPGRQKGNYEIKDAKLNWTTLKDRPFCLTIIIAEDIIVVAYASELERFEWAVALYGAIEMAGNGLTLAHLAQVKLSADITRNSDPSALGSRFHSNIPF